jgi:hypothetical protein
MTKRLQKTGRCTFCGDQYHKYGHNAWPVAEARCCHTCNELLVIPARFKLLAETESSHQQEVA